MSYEPFPYFAGLFDAEGSAIITKNIKPRERLTPRLSISMIDKKPIEEFCELFNGSMYAKQSKNLNCKLQYHCNLSFRKALEAAKLMYPFSIIKKENFEKILNHYNEQGHYNDWTTLDKDTKLNYLAGLLDGDGHISIQNESRKNRKYNYNYAFINLVSTNIEAIKRMQSMFYGNILLKPMQKLSTKQCYCIKYTHQKALAVAKQLVNYSRLKKDKYEEILRFYKEKEG